MLEPTEPNLVGLIPKRWGGKYVRFFYRDVYPSASYREGVLTEVFPGSVCLVEHRAAGGPVLGHYTYRLGRIREIETFARRKNPWGRIRAYSYTNEGGKLKRRTRNLNRNATFDLWVNRDCLEKKMKELGQKL